MSCMLQSLNIMQMIISRHLRVMHYFRGHNDGTAAAAKENKRCTNFMNQEPTKEQVYLVDVVLMPVANLCVWKYQLFA